jgi:hypothetical protein
VWSAGGLDDFVSCCLVSFRLVYFPSRDTKRRKSEPAISRSCMLVFRCTLLSLARKREYSRRKCRPGRGGRTRAQYAGSTSWTMHSAQYQSGDIGVRGGLGDWAGSGVCGGGGDGGGRCWVGSLGCGEVSGQGQGGREESKRQGVGRGSRLAQHYRHAINLFHAVKPSDQIRGLGRLGEAWISG